MEVTLLVHAMLEALHHIDLCADPCSSRYGNLLNWQNPGDPFWHYGIGLSELHIFDTGRGLTVFERKDCYRVEGVDHLLLAPDITVARLKCALDAFREWHYSLLGWNCEHLARLIATNQARCYQSQPLWWLADLKPNGDHKEAKDFFDGYLTEHAPTLLVHH